MSGVLKYTVVVRHPDSGEAVALRGGEEVPDWAKDLVQDDDLETPKPAARKTAARSSKDKD